MKYISMMSANLMFALAFVLLMGSPAQAVTLTWYSAIYNSSMNATAYSSTPFVATCQATNMASDSSSNLWILTTGSACPSTAASVNACLNSQANLIYSTSTGLSPWYKNTYNIQTTPIPANVTTDGLLVFSISTLQAIDSTNFYCNMLDTSITPNKMVSSGLFGITVLTSAPTTTTTIDPATSTTTQTTSTTTTTLPRASISGQSTTASTTTPCNNAENVQSYTTFKMTALLLSLVLAQLA